eukprot:3281621-Pyramimonas_sp.AAC.1
MHLGEVPTRMPVECLRAPEARQWSWNVGDIEGLDFATSWDEWVDNSGLELCRVFDLYGEDRRGYAGRSEGFSRATMALEGLPVRRARFRLASLGGSAGRPSSARRVAATASAARSRPLDR